MTQNKFTGGTIKRGGSGDKPIPPKPQIKPSAQKISSDSQSNKKKS